MEQGIRISSTGKLRSNKHKAKEEKILSIVNAYYLGSYNILLFFNTGEQKIINFLPLLSKYVQGSYSKYLEQKAFKKFNLHNGNIFWGKNEDVIFPVTFLYNQPLAKKIKEEVLYVL